MSRKYSLQGLIIVLFAVVLVSGCATQSASSPEKIQRALAVDASTSVDQYILGATDVVRSSLSEYIREPQVSVVVTSMGSHEFTDRVRVTGAVRQPLSIPHRSGMTVLDIFLNAGGANEFAALNNAMLYRKFEGEVVAIPVELGDILNKGQVRTNYLMRPGDILTVPERSF